jgi:hypothetical protein
MKVMINAGLAQPLRVEFLPPRNVGRELLGNRQLREAYCEQPILGNALATGGGAFRHSLNGLHHAGVVQGEGDGPGLLELPRPQPTNSGLQDHEPGRLGITVTRQILGLMQETRMQDFAASFLPQVANHKPLPQAVILSRQRAGCQLRTTGSRERATGFEPATSSLGSRKGSVRRPCYHKTLRQTHSALAPLLAPAVRKRARRRPSMPSPLRCSVCPLPTAPSLLRYWQRDREKAKPEATRRPACLRRTRQRAANATERPSM